MNIEVKTWGRTPDNKDIKLYTLTNANGIKVQLSDIGAGIVSIVTPDRYGHMEDIALGYQHPWDYYNDGPCAGKTPGRYANRIANGRFKIDDKEYQLELNTSDGKHHLHGGSIGFANQKWASRLNGESVVFTYLSADGEAGYPAELLTKVYYTLNDENELNIRYCAYSSDTTIINLTNHTYFNLAGHDHGTVRDHEVYIDADVITPVDEGLIPLGTYMPVSQTPFDMRDGLLLGDGLDMMAECPQMQPAGGYDHNFVLTKGLAMGLAACVYHEESGRSMEVITDQPAMQLYTACTTNISGGKGGAHYGKYSGFCLETQHCPDDPNNPQFPGTTVLRPGEKYDTTTIYAFRVDE